MKIARIVVLTIALGAGGVAAYLARGTDTPPPRTSPSPNCRRVEVLVAKSDIGLGQSVKPDDLQWQTWPAATASNSFIRRDNGDGMKSVIGSIARSPFIAGEPIREQKLVKANGSGFMAAILPTGMRADLDRDFAGNRRRRLHPAERPRRRASSPSARRMPTRPAPTSSIPKSSCPTCACSRSTRRPKEKEGQNAVVGRTVTLELKPEQAETLARSRQGGTLSLALRSIADINMVENASEQDAPKRGESIKVVRYGVQSTTTTQK